MGVRSTVGGSRHGQDARAGLAGTTEIRVGAAVDSLQGLQAEGAGPFDLVFIDADKPNNQDYLAWSLALTHVGSVIIADNVVRNGAITDSASSDPSVRGVQQFIKDLGSNPRLAATALQTVGSKGYDGLAVALVVDAPASAQP